MKSLARSSFAGLSLCVAGFTLALALFILSLPGISLGLWPQSELEAVGLHVSGAFCATGLLLVNIRHRQLVRAILLHPLVVLPFGVALVSLVFAPIHKLPVKSFLGAPQSGEGVAWWIDWPALTASALLLCRLYWWRRILPVFALGSFVTCAAMTLIHYHYHKGLTPFFFPDFLAINLFSLLIVAACFVQKKRPAVFWLAIYAVFQSILFLTNNMIAIAYSLIGVPFFMGVKLASWISARVKNALALTALAGVPVAAIFLLFGLMHFTGAGGFYDWHNIGFLRNILSRSYLIDIAIRPLLDHPAYLLTGTGWGTYAEHVVSYIPVNWYDFTLEYGSQWEGIAWDQFHTHNLYMEALYTAGILASALLYAYTVAIPLLAAPSRRWAAFIWAGAFASIVSFWFLFPLNVAYIALALGFLAKPVRPHRLELFKNFTVPLLVIAVILQISAAYMSYALAKTFHGYAPPPLAAQDGPHACTFEYRDFGAGGLHLAQKLLYSTRSIVQPGKEPEDIDKNEQIEELPSLNNIYCQTGLYMQSHDAVSNRLLIARLITRGEILLGMQTPPDPDTVAFYTEDWQEELENMLRIAPSRSDQAVPFLSWYLIQGEEDRVAKVAREIHLLNPRDPVGLWFTGIHMTGSAETAQEGIARMRKALDNGIERFLPIEEEIKSQLQSAQ